MVRAHRGVSTGPPQLAGSAAAQGLSRGEEKMGECKHLDEIRDVQPHTKGCEECLKMGDRWVHLRLCLTCGHVGCCDSSNNKHATKHFHATKTPIMRSID